MLPWAHDPLPHHSRSKLFEQLLRFLQIALIKSFGRPAVHGSENLASRLPFTLMAIAEQVPR